MADPGAAAGTGSAPELPRQTVLRLTIADDLDGLVARAAIIDESTAGVVEHTQLGRRLVLHDPDGHTLVLLDAGPSTPAR